jgi:hypothetical protein
MNQDSTRRPARFNDDSIAASRALVATARDAVFVFLRIELDLANTMLDGAAVSGDEAGRRRRRDRAVEAYEEVVHYLGIDAARTGISPADRQELSVGVHALQARLADAGGPTGCTGDPA